MRPTIGAKVFGIAVGLLLLMGAAALLSLRMTRTVDDQLGVIDDNYFPAYAALAQAHIRTVEEAAAIRRLLAALAGPGRDDAAIADLEQRIAAAAEAGDGDLAEARRQINAQINDALDFDDNVALARLDTRLEHLQGARQDYEARLARLVAASMRRAKSSWPRSSATRTACATTTSAAPAASSRSSWSVTRRSCTRSSRA